MIKKRNLDQQLAPWQKGHLGGYDTPATEGEIFHILHGNGLCSRVLQPMAEQLDIDGQFLFTDVPGHGISQQPKVSRPDWNQMAGDIAQSLQERASKPVIGIAHSLGGVLTSIMASDNPKLFKRIILLDPVLFPQYVLSAQKFLRYTGLGKRQPLITSVLARRRSWPDQDAMLADLKSKRLYRDWDDQALSAFVQYGSKLNKEQQVELACRPEWEANIFMSWPESVWSKFKNIDCPIDILTASHSFPFVDQGCKKAAKVNKNVTLHPIKGSHCFAMELASETAKRISVIIG